MVNNENQLNSYDVNPVQRSVEVDHEDDEPNYEESEDFGGTGGGDKDGNDKQYSNMVDDG